MVSSIVRAAVRPHHKAPGSCLAPLAWQSGMFIAILRKEARRGLGVAALNGPPALRFPPPPKGDECEKSASLFCLDPGFGFYPGDLCPFQAGCDERSMQIYLPALLDLQQMPQLHGDPPALPRVLSLARRDLLGSGAWKAVPALALGAPAGAVSVEMNRALY